MAKITKTAADKKTTATEDKKTFKVTRQQKIIFGCLLILFAMVLLLSFLSFFIYGQDDQSAVNAINDRTETVHNWLGKVGAYLANIFVYKGFGAASFLLVRLFFLTGSFLVLDISLKKLRNTWFWDIFVIIILSASGEYFMMDGKNFSNNWIPFQLSMTTGITSFRPRLQRLI